MHCYNYSTVKCGHAIVLYGFPFRMLSFTCHSTVHDLFSHPYRAGKYILSYTRAQTHNTQALAHSHSRYCTTQQDNDVCRRHLIVCFRRSSHFPLLAMFRIVVCNLALLLSRCAAPTYTADQLHFTSCHLASLPLVFVSALCTSVYELIPCRRDLVQRRWRRVPLL